MDEKQQPRRRVVVTGATGNVGTAVVAALSQDPVVESIVAIASRAANWPEANVEMVIADVTENALEKYLDGADVVIHLAWLFQPTHQPAVTWRTNVLGSIRVFEAAARANVPAIVYASSVGAYSPGPDDQPVDETWPTHGWPEASYPLEKSYLERYLDGFERAHPQMRIVRMRPGFIFQRESASQQRRLFAGPFVPHSLVRSGLVPIIPDVPGLRLQALHTSDVADAYHLAAVRSTAKGAFNLAAEPVVTPAVLAELLDARLVPVPAKAIRLALGAAWTLHAVPASPGLFETVLQLPIMDATRARTELGWTPRYSATEALAEFIAGLRENTGASTPPLRPKISGGRLGELRTGVGERP